MKYERVHNDGIFFKAENSSRKSRELRPFIRRGMSVDNV